MLMFIIYTNILFSVNYLLNSGFALNNINANIIMIIIITSWVFQLGNSNQHYYFPTYVDQEVFRRGVSLHCMWVLSMSLHNVYDWYFSLCKTFFNYYKNLTNIFSNCVVKHWQDVPFYAWNRNFYLFFCVSGSRWSRVLFFYPFLDGVSTEDD